MSRQIPHLHHTVATTTGEVVQRARVLGHRVYTVHMTVAHLSQKRGCKETLELDSIEGPSVFTSSFKWMLSGIEVSGLSNDRGSRRLLGGRGTRKSFDFLSAKLASFSRLQQNEQKSHHAALIVVVEENDMETKYKNFQRPFFPAELSGRR